MLLWDTAALVAALQARGIPPPVLAFVEASYFDGVMFAMPSFMAEAFADEPAWKARGVNALHVRKLQQVWAAMIDVDGRDAPAAAAAAAPAIPVAAAAAGPAGSPVARYYVI